MKDYDIIPTLPVTASVVNRHHNMFLKIQKLGVEFAIHGYRHIDYTQLDKDEVKTHIQSAIDIFEHHGLHWSGYRFPLLRRDDSSKSLLKQAGFLWDSSDVVSWNSLKSDDFSEERWQAYQRILETYHPVHSEDTQILPQIVDGLVEMPVSVPDDDIIIERLGLTDTEKIISIWRRMLDETRERGELLVLQIHPERFDVYRSALENIIQSARAYGDVWIAPLGQIARWWNEKRGFHFKLKEASHRRYTVSAHCSDRATPLILDHASLLDGGNPFKHARVMQKRSWEIESPTIPVIGLKPSTSPEILDLLNQEGFTFEITEYPENCSACLKHAGVPKEEGKKRIYEMLKTTEYPLVRFWRWPNAARCCLAISGDIDSVDLRDFWERFYG
jgi:peptidoglycan/xylan/chitin deacetylase (PgdA/CDA1 family)